MDFEFWTQVVSATIAVAAVLSNFIPRHTLFGRVIHFLAARKAVPAPPKDESVSPAMKDVAAKSAMNTQAAIRERLQEADRAGRAGK